MGRRKRAGLHLLADEKSELALSRLGGASSRLWQPDALCLVEGPPFASASSLCADSEIAHSFARAVSASQTRSCGGLTGGLPRVMAGLWPSLPARVVRCRLPR